MTIEEPLTVEFSGGDESLGIFDGLRPGYGDTGVAMFRARGQSFVCLRETTTAFPHRPLLFLRRRFAVGVCPHP
ncbi:MAG TPA: hypothetical protein VGF39_12055, partial [Stellaceae bacterium]